MDKPITQWQVADLEALIGEEETSNLEFKDARSLINEDKTKSEIYKDVSAMANAAGGRIIYGIGEDGSGRATALAPIPDRKGIEDWFQQIVNSNIEPKIQGLVIHKIVLPDDGIALIVDIPQATTFAPHMSKPAKQYFRRHNSTVLPMLDHEVRDLMRRSSSPELYLRYAILPAGGNRNLFALFVFFGNVAKEPALYSQVELIFEDGVAPIQPDAGWQMGNVNIHGVGQGKVYKRQFMVPNHMPIMMEREQPIYTGELLIQPNARFTLIYQISAPGFFKSGTFRISRLDDDPSITFSPDEITRRPA